MSNFRKDEEYIIIKLKKPSKLILAANRNTNYYGGFRINKSSGPYLWNNKWCIDTKYYPNISTTYAISIGNILNDEIKEVHDVIIENINNTSWPYDFIQWFCAKAVPQPLLHHIGDIIYSQNKHIAISWIANGRECLCWNSGSSDFYTKSAMLYGGKEMNVHKSINEQTFIFYENKPMYYTSNYAEFVANHFCSPISRLLSLANHDKKICMIKTLYLYLRRIPSYYLRHHKYGKEHEIKIPIIYELFVPYILDILQNKSVYYEQTATDLFFNINDIIGDSIFNENVFSRMYGNDKVFAYSIQFIHHTKGNNLFVKFYVLQQDQSRQNAPILGYDIVNQ